MYFVMYINTIHSVITKQVTAIMNGGESKTVKLPHCKQTKSPDLKMFLETICTCIINTIVINLFNMKQEIEPCESN